MTLWARLQCQSEGTGRDIGKVWGTRRGSRRKKNSKLKVHTAFLNYDPATWNTISVRHKQTVCTSFLQQMCGNRNGMNRFLLTYIITYEVRLIKLHFLNWLLETGTARFIASCLSTHSSLFSLSITTWSMIFKKPLWHRTGSVLEKRGRAGERDSCSCGLHPPA